MKNPKRNSRKFREHFFSLATVLGAFVAAGTVAGSADAGVITADSKAWTNSGLTGEVGADYRSFEQTKTRTESRTREIKVVVPATDTTPEYTTTQHQVYHVTVPYKQRNSGLQGSGKLSGRVSSDILLSVGYDRSLYGGASIKNGNLVGSIGTTAFNSDRSQLFGSVAFSPIKNTAVFVDFRQGQTSYGVQQQLGNAFAYGAYSPATKGYSVGIGLEIAPAPTSPGCPDGYAGYDGGCIKTIPAPTPTSPG